jgi:stage II sporulation protein AA (anti-sigma F factor antagonist)
MKITTVEDIKIVAMEARFDAYSAKDVETELKELVENRSLKIICDFSKTEYISSAGLRVLLFIAKKLQQLTGKLVLCSVSAYVKEVFEMSGFVKIFTIANSQQDALTKF